MNHIEEAKKLFSSIKGGYRPSPEDEAEVHALIAIAEQLRIANLIAMRAAWTPVEARHSADMQDFYHIGNQIDADIAEALGIKEES